MDDFLRDLWERFVQADSLADGLDERAEADALRLTAELAALGFIIRKTRYPQPAAAAVAISVAPLAGVWTNYYLHRSDYATAEKSSQR